jgi:hypothetical protein
MVRDASLRDAPHHEDIDLLILRSARRARLEG